ncbi:MAG: MlaD family protein [Thermodesulfobacteriota bacterium]
MSRQAHTTLIGAFVLGAVALAVATTLILAGGTWFRERRQHVLYFEGAAQGLRIGAPVLFLGVKVGGVTRIQLGLDDENRRFMVPVVIEMEPHMVRSRSGEQVDLEDRDTIRRLVDEGLRGRLRTQSLLTGQLYVDLDFHPDKLARFVGLDPEMSEIPTIPTTVDELATQFEGFPVERFLAEVATIGEAVSRLLASAEAQELPARLQAVLARLESLAAGLDREAPPLLAAVRAELAGVPPTLAAAQEALARVNEAAVAVSAAADRVAAVADRAAPPLANIGQAGTELAQAAQALAALAREDSPTVVSLNAATAEIGRAARSLRLLAETLEAQPESLLRGKRLPEEK